MPERPVVVTGASGSLGLAVVEALGTWAVPLTHAELDIADEGAVGQVIRAARPRLVVNCAAATDVDRCETDATYRERGNVVGPAVLAEAALREACGLIHVSTDFVFDGEKGSPYSEEDEPRPANAYGLSKLAGERAVVGSGADALVVRTSWVYGDGPASFAAKVLAWSRRRDVLRVAADQWGSPTYAHDLASGVLRLWETGARGVLHLAGEGCASRFELAGEVVEAAGRRVLVQPAAASEFPAPAIRPRATCLDCSAAAVIGVRLPGWRDGVRRWAARREEAGET